jgi:hypothetical protein
VLILFWRYAIRNLPKLLCGDGIKVISVEATWLLMTKHVNDYDGVVIPNATEHRQPA